MTLASEGTFPNDPGSSQTLTGGIFVGESHNVGTFDGNTSYDDERQRTLPKSITFPIRGFEMYDGPMVRELASVHKRKGNRQCELSKVLSKQ